MNIKDQLQKLLDAGITAIGANQLALILGVHSRTIKNWALKGKIPHIPTPGGCHYRYRVSELIAWAESLK